MKRILRIGTRDSPLALWQAHFVRKELKRKGVTCELVPVKSTGDRILDQPLYTLGITGIFTRTLDTALLNEEIDLAVHSMKDVPTVLPDGIVQVAVPARADAGDILVHKGLDFLEGNGLVATGSLRRSAQWLNRYPGHRITGLRGNVQTRLQHLETSDWNGAIFASAGLDRVNLRPTDALALPWMLPAPAQGALVIVARTGDSGARSLAADLNDIDAARAVAAERMFLRTLEGGCTAPIGAFAEIRGNDIRLRGGLFSLDGQQALRTDRTGAVETPEELGETAANEILKTGGTELMEAIRKTLKT